MATILYAEDDRDIRELFAFVLRQRDYTVYEANNGAQAVQIVREEPVDLVILDVRMPMMTGFDAARIIAKDAPQVPVVFLSAKGMSHEIAKGFECGEMVVDYLVKPIAPDRLLDRVDAILQGCKSRGLPAVRREGLAQLVMVR